MIFVAAPVGADAKSQGAAVVGQPLPNIAATDAAGNGRSVLSVLAAPPGAKGIVEYPISKIID